MRRLLIFAIAIFSISNYSHAKFRLRCDSESLGLDDIRVMQVTRPFRDHVKTVCEDHFYQSNKWSAFSYFQVIIFQKSLSGTACETNSTFYFKSDLEIKYIGDVKVVIDRDYYRRSKIIVDGEEHDLSCHEVYSY